MESSSLVQGLLSIRLGERVRRVGETDGGGKLAGTKWLGLCGIYYSSALQHCLDSGAHKAVCEGDSISGCVE